MADKRIHQIAGALSSDLVFKQLTGVERLGQPYWYSLQVLSMKKDISPYDVIGKTMSVSVQADNSSTRRFHGYVTAFSNAGAAGGYQLYEVELRPWLWLLDHSRDCFIFQGKTVLQILEDIFKTKNGFDDFRIKCQRSYQVREYCVQYRESDFSFANRLMEQEGIYYYFEHEESKHTLVLEDAPSAHTPKANDKE